MTENTFLLLVLKKFDLHFEGTSSNSINQSSGSPEPFKLPLKMLLERWSSSMVYQWLTSHLQLRQLLLQWDRLEINCGCRYGRSNYLMILEIQSIQSETNRCSWYRTISAPTGPVLELLCWFLRIIT